MNQQELEHASELKRELQTALGQTEEVRARAIVQPWGIKLKPVEESLKRCISALRDVDNSNANCAYTGTIHSLNTSARAVESLADAEDMEVEILNDAIDAVVDLWRVRHGEHVPCPSSFVNRAIERALCGRQFAGDYETQTA